VVVYVYMFPLSLVFSTFLQQRKITSKTYKKENRSAPPTSDHRALLTNRPENTESHPIHGVKRSLGQVICHEMVGL
jgi:hypothetical protein